jgi:hypothetical protein
MSTGIRDRRYLSGAAYIRTKQDLIFRDVFKVIPKTVVCKDLGIQPNKADQSFFSKDLVLLGHALADRLARLNIITPPSAKRAYSDSVRNGLVFLRPGAVLSFFVIRVGFGIHIEVVRLKTQIFIILQLRHKVLGL